jgi:hypothetical protein
MRLSFLLIAISVIQSTSSQDKPYLIVNEPASYAVGLPSRIQKVLTEYDSSFVTWRFDEYEDLIQKTYQVTQHQLPFAIIGDFNNDGITDIILDGHDATNEYLLAVLSSDSTWIVTELGRTNYISSTIEKRWSSLTFVAKGSIVQSVEPDTSVQLKVDAFEQGSEKASGVTYLENGHWVGITTGD